jgi:signal peptidase
MRDETDPADDQLAARTDGGDRADGEGWALFARDIVTSVLAVALVGIYLFAISGVWPPMVAIESGSMEPNMEINDLVFVMDNDRFEPGQAHGETGVVTAANASGYDQFGNGGDVIVFTPNGNGGTTPIIHRAMFWVEAGENWCEQANPDFLGTNPPDGEICEADHAGFITKGDANSIYDQVPRSQTRVEQQRLSAPVKPEWVVGTAELRIPGLGWLRLRA